MSDDKLERIKVVVSPRPDQVIKEGVNLNDLYQQLRAAGWTGDPGEGVAYLLPDANGNPAYEVLNPVPFAPPIGWTPTPPIEELIRERVRHEVARLRDDEEIDDINDAEDFDIPDELPPLQTMYEVIAMEAEAPALRGEKKLSVEEEAKLHAEYLDAVDQQRLLRKRSREAALRKQRDELSAQLELEASIDEMTRRESGRSPE